MQILEIELSYWIEWFIWLIIWIILLIITNKQIKTFNIDSQIVVAAVGNRRASQDDAPSRRSSATNNKSNIVSNIKTSRMNRRASYTPQYTSHHRNSSRRLSLQTSPRRYSLNLRPQSMGYQLRKKKLQLQLIGIISNIIIHLLLFPYFRFASNDISLRFNVILTYIPCVCGTCFYVLDIYLLALRTFSLHHLFNETQHRNVNIYIQLKSLQNNVKFVTSFMCVMYAISVLGVSISKLSIFWFFSEISCWILWYLLNHRYYAIKSLYHIISTDLTIANRKLLEMRSNNLNKKENSKHPENTNSKSEKPNSKKSDDSLKIDFGDTKPNVSGDSSSPSPTKQSPSKPAERLSKISINVEQSISIKSAASDAINTGISSSSSKTSTPRVSMTRKISLNALTSDHERVGINAESISLRRQLTAEKLMETVSKSLQSIVKSAKEENQEMVKDERTTSKYEATIYNDCKVIKDETEMEQYVDDLRCKTEQIAHAARLQWIFGTMWLCIGIIYLVRRIYVLVMDVSAEAIQFSYDKDIFKPLSFEIVPFLILWVFAIYSSQK